MNHRYLSAASNRQIFSAITAAWCMHL